MIVDRMKIYRTAPLHSWTCQETVIAVPPQSDADVQTAAQQAPDAVKITKYTAARAE